MTGARPGKGVALAEKRPGDACNVPGHGQPTEEVDMAEATRRTRVEKGIYRRPDGRLEIGWRDAQGALRRRVVAGGISAAPPSLLPNPTTPPPGSAPPPPPPPPP